MSRTKHTIGPYTEFLLIGGGELLADLADWAKKTGLPIAVLTSPRHAESEVRGISLLRRLKESGIDVAVLEKLDPAAVKPLLPRPDRTFSLSFGAAWIFTAELIEGVFKDNLYNLHSTRLPQDRGGGGYSWQILAGSRFGFCNIHKLEPGIDRGEIIFSREFLYPSSCRVPKEYEDAYIPIARGFLQALLKDLSSDAVPISPISQPEYLSTYWPRLNTHVNGWLDWRWSPSELERFICAFDDPYAGAQTMWNGRRVFLKKASLNFQDGRFHPYQAGLIFRKSAEWLCVAADSAALIIEQVTDEEGVDILGSIKVGDRFHTPAQYLEDATKRVSYSPTGLNL